MQRPNYHLVLVLLCILVLACGGSDDSVDEETPTSSYVIPQSVGDGITTEDGANLGIDTEWLSGIETSIREGEFINIHSVLVAKEGKLVYETYYSGSDVFGQPSSNGIFVKHRMHSVTKSFASAFVGIALDQTGLSLETPLFEHFPEYDFSHDARKSAITLEDALSMSAGFDWDESSYAYEDPRNNHEQMYDSGDWVDYIVNRPMAETPGTTFVYNSGLSILLGEFVSNVSNKSLGNFARTNLFAPLGIDAEWFVGPNGVYQTGGGLRITSRSLLKFGLLYQNNGRWNGQQIIPEAWVTSSTSGQGANPTNYGHQWWRTTYAVGGRTFSAYLAVGRGGQRCIVVPEAELVAVFTAGNDNVLSSSQTRAIMTRYILRSLF